MENNNRFKIIVFFAGLLFLVTLVQETYAKYRVDADGTATVNIARWNIVVNEQDIIDNNYITNTLTPTFAENPHIADGVIAPTAIGYFDLNIDCTNVDVSFSYSISTELDAENDVDDLVVIGYTVDGGAMNAIEGQMDEVSEDIYFDATNKTRDIRIYVQWDDSESATMDNASDTQAALAEGSAKINAMINFTQIVD